MRPARPLRCDRRSRANVWLLWSHSVPTAPTVSMRMCAPSLSFHPSASEDTHLRPEAFAESIVWS